MTWEHQKSGTTIFFDIIRYIFIFSGTGFVLYFICKYNWVLAVIAAIPVFIIMLNLFGFLTLPLYLLTPESRAGSKTFRSLDKGDIDSTKAQTEAFIRDFNVNVPEEDSSDKKSQQPDIKETEE